MADSKLSALAELAVEPASTDELYVNDGGTSKRILWSTLKAVFATAAQGAKADTAIQAATNKPVEHLSFALSDETTALTTGLKLTYRMPYAFTLTDIKASVTTAPTGATLIADVHEGTSGGTSIMTTDKLAIEATEFSTEDATTQPALTDTSLAADAELTFYIDQIGSTIAGAGLKVTLIGTRT